MLELVCEENRADTEAGLGLLQGFSAFGSGLGIDTELELIDFDVTTSSVSGGQAVVSVSGRIGAGAPIGSTSIDDEVLVRRDGQGWCLVDSVAALEGEPTEANEAGPAATAAPKGGNEEGISAALLSLSDLPSDWRELWDPNERPERLFDSLGDFTLYLGLGYEGPASICGPGDALPEDDLPAEGGEFAWRVFYWAPGTAWVHESLSVLPGGADEYFEAVVAACEEALVDPLEAGFARAVHLSELRLPRGTGDAYAIRFGYYESDPEFYEEEEEDLIIIRRDDAIVEITYHAEGRGSLDDQLTKRLAERAAEGAEVLP